MFDLLIIQYFNSKINKMNMYYFGSSLQYIEAGYAASNRSSCKSCKQKIQKDQLRIGLILDDDHFNAKYWYHLKCFQLKPRHLQMAQDKIEQKIYNIDHLQEADYNAVVQHMKQELDRVKNKRKAPKKETKKQSKKDSKKNTKKASKKKKVESESEQSSSSQSQSSFQSQQDSEEQNKKKKKKAPKKAKAEPAKSKVYSDVQSQQFAKLCEKFNAMTSNQLKQILAKNNQSKNGNKNQLVEKCADGKILGQIPKCQSCGGGRLRFDRQTGVYSCPGYMEDTDFIHCNKKYELSEVTRTQWVD